MSDDNKVVPIRSVSVAAPSLRDGMIEVLQNMADCLRDGSFDVEDIAIAIFLREDFDGDMRVSVRGFRDDAAAAKYFASFIKQHGFSLPTDDEHEDV